MVVKKGKPALKKAVKKPAPKKPAAQKATMDKGPKAPSKVVEVAPVAATKGSSTFKAQILVLGRALKDVTVNPRTTYGDLASKEGISSYILCVGPEKVDPYSYVKEGDVIVAMPKGKAGRS